MDGWTEGSCRVFGAELRPSKDSWEVTCCKRFGSTGVIISKRENSLVNTYKRNLGCMENKDASKCSPFTVEWLPGTSSCWFACSMFLQFSDVFGILHFLQSYVYACQHANAFLQLANLDVQRYEWNMFAYFRRISLRLSVSLSASNFCSTDFSNLPSELSKASVLHGVSGDGVPLGSNSGQWPLRKGLGGGGEEQLEAWLRGSEVHLSASKETSHGPTTLLHIIGIMSIYVVKLLSIVDFVVRKPPAWSYERTM